MLQRDLFNLFGPPRDTASYLKVINLREFVEALGPVRDYEGNTWGFRMYAHEMMEAPLRRAFQNIMDRGLADEFVTFDGCLSIRQMTGGGGYSTHSWALAIDINAEWNRYGQEPNMSPEFVKCFTDAGFEWGGTWRTPDGMHFQLPKTRGA
jgi:hypothetical protein